MFDLSVLKNFDLLSVGVVVAAIGLLGFIIFLNNAKSTTNRLFGTFIIVTILWTIVNYLSYQFTSPGIIIWLLRFEIFFAVWLTYFLLCLLTIFPSDTDPLPRYLKLLSIFSGIVSLVNLSPLVFIRISKFTSDGHVSEVVNGPAIIIFGICVMFNIFMAIWVLYKKTLRASTEVKRQFRPILVGISMTFILLFIFNFIFPAFLNNANYISLGGLFIFPLIAGVSYSIIKHRLFNVKVISTEILVFFLSVVTLFEIITANSVAVIILRSSEFLLVLGVGIMLVRSVLNEIREKEQLQKVTTELSNANEQLKALDKARAEFISIASHQLRTPPATVKWYLSSILEEEYGPLDPKVKEMLGKTERTNNLLISLIEDMLNVSRIERGKMEFLFEPVDVEDMAKVTFEQLQPLAEEKKQTLVYNPPPAILPKINADKEKLRQVMNNLIDNAIKYTPSGGHIVIDLQLIKDSIRFSVTDNGKGISPEEQGEIFEKYKRGKESIKHSAGLGLGLYVAKIIIEQHKGKIWAESPGEGKGSSFIFDLPIHSGVKETTLVDFANS